MQNTSKAATMWQLINTMLESMALKFRDVFLLLIRLYWGWQFFLTGKGKLFHLDDTASFFAELNIPLPKFQAFLAGGVECFGGLLLLVGLASRVTALPLIFIMLVAYATAHREELSGLFTDSDAFVTAAPFLFLMASVIVFVFGPGRISLDHLLTGKKTKN